MTAVTTTTFKGQRTNRLPAEVTSFIGRRHEVAEVKRLLAASRTVTLTGVGGVGKTRLALRVAQELRRAFRDGVWLAELASLHQPGLLAETVVEALEIRGHATPPIDVLTGHLHDKHALLILDNCEHLVHECAVLAETLLRAAPDLRILATSRQALGIPSEQAMPVPPLHLPDGQTPRSSLATLAQTDAVRLFTERARAVLPTFALTEDNREVIARIVRRLDGLPLGIELAAVRLRALSAQQLLDRLDDRFRLLNAGSRAELPRHQTLRALIDWSYALCSDEERLLWERASAFAGGLDLEAAETICSGRGIDRHDIVHLVIGLVDKSVLTREDHPCGVRYRMLDTLSAYGRERLAASGQQDWLRERHAGYYRDLAARARADLFGPRQVHWLTRLHLEHANLRTALEQSYTGPDGARAGLTMATDLLYHWTTSYYPAEGRRWLQQGLAACDVPDDVRACALWAGGWLAIIQADEPAATTMLHDSRRAGERLHDQHVLGYVALFSGMIAMKEGRTAEAITLYEQALARHQAFGDPAGTALSLIRLTLAYSHAGDTPSAVAAGERCLALCESHHESWHRAYAMMALGIQAWRQGDLRRATNLQRKALTVTRSLGDYLGIGITVEALAWISATQRRHQRAARLLGILQTVWASVGAPLSGYGHLAGHHDACEQDTRQALGEDTYSAAVRRGARMPLDEALAYILQEEPLTGRGKGRQRLDRLTRRESEIAHLVARGLTNKEIGACLVISQRTAEGHIEHILTKLGFSSRSQIAAWAGEQARTQDRPAAGG
ncbi:tetratricopeptide repeat protein [Nonomuraea sp. KC401]|uniref:ATP-binding protein n=1 Tax=Nonomuraea sp. K271 TaxID=1848319 RepID=UPI0010FED8AD|nr:tetratricopeptide repeat protein [Nonomuraea sp. K271]TLF49728.1 tetratricopeptide repeat protein [Nonomuraea sp. KC401]